MSHINATPITMVEFDAVMWDGFQGAECGPRGEQPRSNAGDREVFLDGRLAIVFADANGVSVVEADSDNQWILSVPNYNIALTVFIAEHLGVVAFNRINIYAADLHMLGFTQV